MNRRVKNIPAFIVKKNHHGKNVKINGSILSINESERTADMRILDKVYTDIPFENIRVNEAFIDDLKAFGKKGVEKIKNIFTGLGTMLKKVKGKLVTLFGGKVLSINPILIAQNIGNSKGGGVWLTPEDRQIAAENGINLPEFDVDKIVTTDPSDLDAMSEFWKNVIADYKQSETVAESFGSSRAKGKALLESYKKAVRMNEWNYRMQTGHWDAAPKFPGSVQDRISLNEEYEFKDEKTIGQIYEDAKVVNKKVPEIKNQIITNLKTAIKTGISPKPLLIWGAPGVGKTVVIRNIIKEFEGAYNELERRNNNSLSESEDVDISELETKLAELEAAQARYKSQKRATQIEELKSQIASLQSGTAIESDDTLDDDHRSSGDYVDPNMKIFFDSRGKSEEVNKNRWDNVSTPELKAKYGTPSFADRKQRISSRKMINPAGIYITCNGMAKDAFSLPSFGDMQGERKTLDYDKLVKRFGEESAKYIMDYAENNPDEHVLERLTGIYELSMSNKALVSEVPKSWLPLYMPTGLPEIDKVLDEETYTLNHEYNPNSKNCGILFIDELSRVATETMNVIMQLVDQREFEKWKMGSKWIFVCAANRPSDMSQKNKSEFNWEGAWGTRFYHVNVTPTKADWIEWARSWNDDKHRHNIEPEWIINFIEMMPDNIWINLNTNVDPKTGKVLKSGESSKGGQRITDWNARTWEAAADDIFNMIETKLMYKYPDIYKNEWGQELSDEDKEAIIWELSQGEIPEGWNSIDPNDLKDIENIIMMAMGNDQSPDAILPNLKTFFQYREYWTPTRCREVCMKGAPNDPDDDNLGKLPKWKTNTGLIEEVFKLIREEAVKLSNPKGVMDEIIQMLWNAQDTDWVKKAIYDQNGQFKLVKSMTSGKEYRGSVYHILFQYEVMNNLDGKSATEKAIKVYNNIIDYALKIAKQIAAVKTGEDTTDDYSTQIISLLLGDKKADYRNGIIWQAIQYTLLDNCGNYVIQVLKDKNDTDKINAVREDLPKWLGYMVQKFIYNKVFKINGASTEEVAKMLGTEGMK